MTALQGMMSQFLLQKREHLETWFAQEMFQTSCELPKAPLAEVYAPSGSNFIATGKSITPVNIHGA